MRKYAFWNNKGGTGKTSLIFQTILAYAKENPNKKILVLDVCPQANLSELMLGGLVGQGNNNLMKIQGQTPRATIGGYFQMRLSEPYRALAFNPVDFIVKPSKLNPKIEHNISLLAGDSLLELQATAISTLANTQIPGLNTWLGVIDWLRDFLEPISNEYDIVFIDCNPSFSVYTQIALSAADSLVLPVTADDSSRRAVQNVFSLIYGVRLPLPMYAQYSFKEKLTGAGRKLPKVHTIVKNRIAQYIGPSSAYSAILRAIDEQVAELLENEKDCFHFNEMSDLICEMKDFGTAGVVAFARGESFMDLSPGRHNISGRRVQVQEENILDMTEAIKRFAQRIS